MCVGGGGGGWSWSRFSHGIKFPVDKDWQCESAVFTLYNFVHAKGSLKRQFHEITSGFFTWISFPQAPEYPIRAVSNLFKNVQNIRSSNPQISEICESANFFWLISKLQIRKFCWWASLQIANPQIFPHKTEKIKHLFTKFPPTIVYLKVSWRFVWQNFLFDKNLN